MGEIYRRRENRVVSCLGCGDVLGIYIEGEQVPTTPHDCLEEERRPRIGPEAAVDREVLTPNELKGA